MPRGGPFIGRESEVALIRRAAERVRDRRPQFVYVEGLPGVGKTELIRRALEPYSHWRIIERDFDQSVRHTPGEGLCRLFGPRYSLGQDPEDLARQILPQGQAQKEMLAVIVSGFHHADEMTVEALLGQLRVMHNAPVLLVLEGCSTWRDAPAQVIRAAQSSPYGRHLRVEPLSVKEVGQLMAEYLGTPVGAEVAENIHRDTAGYPYLATEVGQRLSSVPLGRRRLGPVLAEVVAQDDPGMAEVISAAVSELGDRDALQALYLLATATQSLKMPELKGALGRTPDLNRLLETGLVVWDETRLGYRMKNRPISRAVVRTLGEPDYAAMHGRLASVVEEGRALHHRVRALGLEPDPERAKALVDELVEDGLRAFAEGDVERSFSRFQAACTLQPEVESMELLARTAAMLGRIGVLEEFQEVFANLPRSPLRQACMAFVALQRGDVEDAVEELQEQPRITDEMAGALLYAQAVAETSMHCAFRGLFGRANAPRMRTLMMLTAYREKLITRPAEAESLGNMPEEWCLGLLESICAGIELWQMLEYRDSEQMVQAIEDIGGAIDRLEWLPFTEYAELVLRAARGTRLRQLGDPTAAYRDLAVVADRGHADGFLLHSQAQLALLLFSAGYWDEAYETALEAAEKVLLQGESASTLIVYAVTVLVPVLRGEDERSARLLEDLCEVKDEHGPIIGAVIDWIEACRSIVQRDHAIAVQQLLEMQEKYEGWWTLGVEPVMLFVHSLRGSGWAGVLARVKASLVTKEVPALEETRQALLVYIEGLQAWEGGDPRTAYQMLAETNRRLHTWPEFWPGGVDAPEGGSFRLYRALLSLDLAALVAQFPEALGEFREVSSEYAKTAALVFRSCRAAKLAAEAEEAAAALREPTAASDSTSSSVATAAKGPAVAKESPSEDLTERQREIARLASEGRTSREVAEVLGISVRTVDYHMGHVLSKLKLRSRHQLRHFEF